MNGPRSSRRRYLQFVEDYKRRRLDDAAPSPEPSSAKPGNRRQYRGQQQRLAIARAILAVPQILMLDEATSNIDTESEQLIQASMSTLLAGRTTFVIAHRLSTVRRADLILLMEEGRIIERGDHEALMQARGVYYEMVQRQMESAREETEKILR